MESHRYRSFNVLIVLLLFISFFVTNKAQEKIQTDPIVSEAVAMGISPPVRELPIISQKEIQNRTNKIIPLRTPFERDKINVDSEGFIQKFDGQKESEGITRNFDGVSALGYSPPDPSGDVGPNHYVQMVNVRTQMWDKNGVTVAGPFDNIDFWASLPGPWSGTNDGDAVVLYDDMADRWFISQFSLPSDSGPFYILIAISITPDPTGSYYQYAFQFPNFPDYPKYGIWPDGYYMSANVFAANTFNYIGTYAYVFDRAAMLAGNPAVMIGFNFNTTTWSFLPSDCDGTPPPTGSPNYFISTFAPYNSGNNNLDVYEFHVDWITPSNSTFTGPLLLTTPTFTSVTGIPQQGTGTLLDDISDRPMNRLQYRNFGAHQSMVFCQTVNAGSGRAGMRWWELRKTSGNWAIYQEGTYAPADGLFRWMGSIAMNQFGDIALGYSVSSTGMYPSIRYTGRLASDPPGVMTISETNIHSGAGSQTPNERWGDYTQMVVDPVSPDVFWYTNQYQPSTGQFNWNTRVAAFDIGSPTQSQFLVWEGAIGGQDYSGAYINGFLVGQGYTVDYTATFPASLIGYDAVFLSFGNYPNNTALDVTKAAVIQEYLENGGRVYLEGGDALEYDQYGNQPLHTLFGLGDGVDGNTNVIDGLEGQSGSICAGMLFTSSTQSGNNYIDIYLPVAGKLAFVESGYGNVGVQYSGLFGQKTFCFSYALGYLTDGTSPSTKDQLMTNILNFLTGPAVIPPDIEITPSSFDFIIDIGGSETGTLTINNVGSGSLLWNIADQQVTKDGFKLELSNGISIPVELKQRSVWKKPVRGNDNTTYDNILREFWNEDDAKRQDAEKINELDRSNILVTLDPGYIHKTQFTEGLLYDNGPIVNSPGTGAGGTDESVLQTALGMNTLGFGHQVSLLYRISDEFTILDPGGWTIDNIVFYAYQTNTTTTSTITAVNYRIWDGPPSDPGSSIIFGDDITNRLISSEWANIYRVTDTSPGSTARPVMENIVSAGFYLPPGTYWIDWQTDGDPLYSGPWAPPITINEAIITGNAMQYTTSWGPAMDSGTNTQQGFPFRIIGSASSDCLWLTENPVSGLVPPSLNQQVDIIVDATGLTTGIYYANLFITSNDPDESYVSIPVILNVESSNPPDINIDPSALTFIVPEGGSDGKLLNISNVAPPGYDNLNWDISEQEVILRPDDKFKSSLSDHIATESQKNNQNNEIVIKKSNVYNYSGKSSYSNGYESKIIKHKVNRDFRRNSDNNLPTLNKILLISAAASPPTDIQSYLLSYIPIVDIFDAISGTPTLIELIEYEAVIVMNDIMFNDPIGLGDVLADYLDAGGGVVTTVASFANGFDIQGRFITGNYSPFISGLGPVGGGNLGTYDPTHPIMDGITAMYGDLLVDPSLSDGSVLVASWDNGLECVATKGNAVAINVFVSQPGYWTGDVPLILSNAAYFAAGRTADIPWISENPVSGSVPAGSNQNIDIIVDATGLSGGSYSCNLLISSNDPDETPVIIPVTLIVTSGPPPENYAIVSNNEDNNVHIVNVDNNTILGPFLTGNLGNGNLLDPVITPDGQIALISNFDESSVYFIDMSNPHNPSVLGTLNIGFYAEDITLTSNGAYALVTDGGVSTKIVVIDVSARTLIQTLDIAPNNSQAIEVGPDGTVLVADHANNKIHVLLLNLSTGLLTDLATSLTVDENPLNISISPDGQTAIVSNFNLTSITVLQITAPGVVSLTGSIPNLSGVQSIAFERDGNRAFAVQTGTSPDELAVLAVTSPGNVIDLGNRVPLLTDASTAYYGVDVIDISADGNWAYVGNPSPSVAISEISVVDLNSYTLSTGLSAGNYPTGIAIGGSGMLNTDFAVNFLVSDNCANSQNLIFGTAPDATDGFDPLYDCYGPPPPPTGAFGGWFESSGEILFCDFRQTNTGDIRTWDVHYQPATGCDPVSFNWNPGELPDEGNFRLVDPFTGTLVNINMRTTDTYTDVAGLGHLQIIYSFEITQYYDMTSGWNMISLPLTVADPDYLILFPNAVPGTLYGFNGSYFSTTTIENSKGYWLRFPSPETVPVQGVELTECPVNLSAGWNMIGGPNCSVPVGNISDPGGIIIPGTFYGFNGSYYSATTVDATKGYWVRANAPGTVTISCTPILAKRSNSFTIPADVYDGFSSIEISDAKKKTQTLYFDGNLDKTISIESFSMPPVAPQGSFDARLAGGYRLSPSDEVTIYIQATNYPLSLTISDLKTNQEYGYVLKEIINNEAVQQHIVIEGNEIMINNEGVEMLTLTKQKAIPTSFELTQNYPNPFNPTTVIKYSLPESRDVKLVIYNSLGEKVKTLVNGFQEPGYYTAIWEGTNDQGSKVGSGMYIYAIKAGKDISVKKMMLVK